MQGAVCEGKRFLDAFLPLHELEMSQRLSSAQESVKKPTAIAKFVGEISENSMLTEIMDSEQIAEKERLNGLAVEAKSKIEKKVRVFDSGGEIGETVELDRAAIRITSIMESFMSRLVGRNALEVKQGLEEKLSKLEFDNFTPSAERRNGILMGNACVSSDER